MKNRIENIRKILNNNQAALVLSKPNRFYLTGFDTSYGAVIITPGSAVFFTDFRYIEKAKKTIKHIKTELLNSLYTQIKDYLDKENINKLFVETDYLSISEYENLSDVLNDIKILKENDLTDVLLESRSVKSEEELANIIKAQEITDKTFSYILNEIKPGKTEKEIMLQMEFFMRNNGADSVGFDFVVVSGKNSSLPHGVPTDKIIENGDFITLDFGATVNGYRSDMTRTVAVGFATDDMKKVYDTVLYAQEVALKNIKAGLICSSIDKLSRDIIYNAGFKGCFGHALGHGVGIEIHESPNFSPKCDTVLKSGTVITVEPGIYIEDTYGVRIEDMVYVTENGIKNLTKSSKELIIL